MSSSLMGAWKYSTGRQCWSHFTPPMPHGEASTLIRSNRFESRDGVLIEYLRARVRFGSETKAKNHFAVGDLVEVVHPSGNITVRLQEMRNVEGQPVQVAQGSPVRVWIPLPARFSGALLARVIESQPPAAAAEPALAV